METESTTTGHPMPLMAALHLSKHYVQGRWFSPNRSRITALDDVSLIVYPRSTLALVGESGSGKSTLGRCLASLEEPDSGEIWLEGTNLLTLTSRELFAVRRRIQLIFQDSAAAMNPRFTAAEIVTEPLAIQERAGKKGRRERALTLMERVGLLPQWADRSPLEFSGGQRQRLAIARALALKPRFLILDEALSGLDLSIQAQIANLLLQLQASFSLTYLYISHDLRLAGHLADEVAVMHRGKIVESGNVSNVFSQPQHPHTRGLIASIPDLARARRFSRGCDDALFGPPRPI
jgi:ABC-type glutathione transport system ATPase component